MIKDYLNSDDSHIKKEKGYADKVITTYNPKARRIGYRGYYVFLIPKNTPIDFKILALKALNKEATQSLVYWVAQTYEKFGTQQWLGFIRGGKKVVNKNTLAERLTELNKNSKKYKDKKYSEEDTKNVGHNYLIAKHSKSTQGDDTFGKITYSTSVLGRGIWLEGCNYFPAWKSQGAFIIAVDDPQIMSFYGKKRISTKNPESHEKNIKFISKTNTKLSEELAYGDIVDLHMHLHNVPYYDIKLVVVVEGEKIIDKVISLNRNETNPALDYNVKQRYELYIDPSWIEQLNHKQSSVKSGKISIELLLNVAMIDKPFTDDQIQKRKREIEFSINYKDKWAIDEYEQQWVPQIAKIEEASLVTQQYEECKFTAIKISDENNSFYILEESEEGSLKINNITPVLEFIAGRKKNKRIITIDLEGVKTDECLQAGFDNTKDKEKSHKENTFNTKHLPTKVVNSALFGSILPVKINQKTENKLQLEFCYPYKAETYNELFLNFMFTWNKRQEYPLIVQTCRYIRTPLIKIFPDFSWAVHVNYAAHTILYYKAKKVELVSFNKNLYDYLKPVVSFLYEKVIMPIEELLKAKKYLASSDEELEGLGDDLKALIEDFIDPENETETINLGYYHNIDGKLINYVNISPHNYFLFYLAFKMSLATLALDIVILYFITGKTKLKKLKKLKTVKSINEAIKELSESNFKFNYPKISINFGYEYEQMPNGEVALVIRFTTQAKPLIGVSIEEEVELLNTKNKAGKESPLKAIFNLNVNCELDINVKYNTLTEEWSLNENATDQNKALHQVKQNKNILSYLKTPPPKEVKNGEAFIDGDVIRVDFKIKGGAKLTGALSKDYYLVPIKAEASIDVEVTSFVGVEFLIGFDKQRGPFMDKSYYFSGLQYQAKVKSIFSILAWPEIFNKDKEESGNIIDPFRITNKRLYLMSEY